MAASITMEIPVALFFSFFLSCSNLLHANAYLYTFQPHNILHELQTGCFLGVTNHNDLDLLSRFAQLADVFQNDEGVTVGIASLEDDLWSDGGKVQIDGLDCGKNDLPGLHNCLEDLPDIVFFPKIKVDRSCLLIPPKKTTLKGQPFVGPSTIQVLVSFLNVKCGTFRLPSGVLSPGGMHREYILDNLFHMGDVSDMTIQKLYSSTNNPLNTSYKSSLNTNVCKSKEICDINNGKVEADTYTKYYPTEIAKCPTITLPLSKEQFFDDYLKRSQPVIIKDAIKNWAAITKWTQEHLREKYGEKSVHVKMTPGGDYEGVEKADRWEDYETFQIPEEVKEKLPYPDLVVVRPAWITIKFSEFLDLITWAAQQPARNVSAYLEYSSIPEYMPELQQDLSEFDFVRDLLKLRHLNMWLSDGNTLGRLHFDPYDNFLCQLKGRKQVIMFEPHDNQKLYEGHIPQATLGYSRTNHTFRRKTLDDSTSMVMSPVDLLNPDLERFPKFADAQPLNCTIDEGDALFMPSFWWHEVYSWPNTEEKRNLAVNFWYEPFLQKEFPCPECKMDVNSFYHDLL